ncbi:hypothetical protein [Hydrocarboniphaga sp.]|uniref:hypothetical protein n=1 Tax=Hydrocarboniphaga sp. TaxID=2033016 RepID=UPI003D12B2B3
MMLCDGRPALRSLLLLPVSALLLLSACSSPDDDGDPTQVSDLTGTITGTIQDTDGHAIANATIRYAGASDSGSPLSATTNADGQFSMPGVTVTGVAGTTVNDANGPITLAIVPPAGYMGATIQASPIAQSTGTVGGGTVFIDDFNVGVGVVKLPALASTVSGTLRSSATGSPVAGASVSLDFVGVEFVQDGTTTGVATTYDSGSFLPVTSNADGSFSLASVYNDSCVKLAVNGYAIGSVSGSAPPCPTAGAASDTNTLNLRTSDANTPVLLASVAVTPFTSADTVPPTVSSVDGVIDPTQTPAQLESSVTRTFAIHFSETLQADLLSASNVYVVLGSGTNATATPVSGVALNGSLVTITLQNALPASTAVTVHIAREALKDTAGNGVADAGALAYDSLSSQELLLSFTSFGSSNTIADAAVVAQVSAQVFANDLSYVTTDALLDTVDPLTTPVRPALTPTSTSTTYTTSAVMEQLNNPAAVTALTALRSAIAPSDTRVIQPGVARVSVTVPANASDFLVWVERAGTKLDALFFPVVTSGGSPTNSQAIDNSGPTYVITPGGASSFDLLIRGNGASVTLQAGDVFHISSRNAAAIIGGSSTAKLADNGRPTVALQLLDSLIAGAAGSGGSGGGGSVIIPPTSSVPAVVVFSITPQAADVNDTDNGYALDNWKGDNELQGLSHTELQDSAFAQGLANTAAIGDADGTAAFLATSPTLGIAVTEPGAYTGVAPVTSGISTSLTVQGLLNNVVNEDPGTSNLLAIQFGNVFQLSRDAGPGTATIDLSGSIKDLNDTVPDAATRASLRLRDKMPPLMTSGSYDGTNFVFSFNEAIQKLGTIDFSGCGFSVALAQDGVTLSEDGTKLTFPASLLGGDPAGCFTTASYPESAYGTGETALEHAAVSYANVPDTAIDPTVVPNDTGNTWALWTAENLGISTPFFAIVNISP